MRHAGITLFSFFILLITSTAVFAVPTTVTVRVKSKDSKFIGTSMGGVLVTIRDVYTDELLAQGVTQGSTGNTDRIMNASATSRTVLSDAQSAHFTATLDIDEPTYIKIAAYGPLAQKQSANRASLTQWIVPGKHISTGDALLLELAGLVVDVQSPPAHIVFERVPRQITITANVTMLCGCPITPGGVWAVQQFEVTALIKKDGRSIGTLPLQYGGEPSQFTGTYEAHEKGIYEGIVYAYDASNGNTGLDNVTFIIR